MLPCGRFVALWTPKALQAIAMLAKTLAFNVACLAFHAGNITATAC